ncbi:hypothetical protein ACQJBY_041757 [Aegilops geniculata]
MFSPEIGTHATLATLVVSFRSPKATPSSVCAFFHADARSSSSCLRRLASAMSPNIPPATSSVSADIVSISGCSCTPPISSCDAASPASAMSPDIPPPALLGAGGDFAACDGCWSFLGLPRGLLIDEDGVASESGCFSSLFLPCPGRGGFFHGLPGPLLVLDECLPRIA